MGSGPRRGRRAGLGAPRFSTAGELAKVPLRGVRVRVGRGLVVRLPAAGDALASRALVLARSDSRPSCVGRLSVVVVDSIASSSGRGGRGRQFGSTKALQESFVSVSVSDRFESLLLQVPSRSSRSLISSGNLHCGRTSREPSQGEREKKSELKKQRCQQGLFEIASPIEENRIAREAGIN